MAISRVDFGGQTLMDLTEDTVTASTLAVGATAHGANGELIRGALNPSSGVESFNGRTGSVLPVGGDYTDNQISLSSAMHIGGNTQTDVAAALAALASNSGGSVIVDGDSQYISHPVALTSIYVGSELPSILNEGQIYIILEE